MTCDAALRNPNHGVSVLVGQGSTDLAYLGMDLGVFIFLSVLGIRPDPYLFAGSGSDPKTVIKCIINLRN